MSVYLCPETISTTVINLAELIVPPIQTVNEPGVNAHLPPERTIRLDKQTEATIQGFEDGIAELDEVMACYLMSGRSDYMLHVLNHSFREYETFIRERLTLISGIGTLGTHVAFGQVKQKRKSVPATLPRKIPRLALVSNRQTVYPHYC